jgi:hypothetical protein
MQGRADLIPGPVVMRKFRWGNVELEMQHKWPIPSMRLPTHSDIDGPQTALAASAWPFR